MLAPRDGVLVGLSGGGDSVALLHILVEIANQDDFPLRVVAAHLNHGLRGMEADEDAAFCRRLTSNLGVEFHETRIQVEDDRSSGESLEEAARRIRYEFLTSTALAHGLHKVAVAHHADDQAETVLMRLARGCGLAGLGAIPSSRSSMTDPGVKVIRPLLSLRKDRLTGYLQHREESFRTDATNSDLAYRRNEIRHVLLPALNRGAGRDLTGDLADMAAAARALNERIEDRLSGVWPDLCRERRNDSLAIDAEEFARFSNELRKRVIRQALTELSPEGQPPDAARDHYEKAAGLADQDIGAGLTLPGPVQVRREHGVIYFRRGNGETSIHPVQLTIPGSTSIGSAGYHLHADFRCMPAGGPKEMIRGADADHVYLSPAAMDMPLSVRTRRAGDRFHPLGAPGTRKLKKFLIDRRVPRHKRDSIPLVVDASGHIVWVAGQEIGHAFRLVGDEDAVLELRLTKESD